MKGAEPESEGGCSKDGADSVMKEADPETDGTDSYMKGVDPESEGADPEREVYIIYTCVHVYFANYFW